MLMTSCIIKGKLRNGAVIDTAPYLPSKRKKHALPAPAMASLKRLTFKQKSQRHASGIVEAKVTCGVRVVCVWIWVWVRGWVGSCAAPFRVAWARVEHSVINVLGIALFNKIHAGVREFRCDVAKKNNIILYYFKN